MSTTVTLDTPTPFGDYVLARAWQYQRPGAEQPKYPPAPDQQIGLWLRAVLGSGHDLTPDGVRRLLPHADPDVLIAAEAEWRATRGWIHSFVGHACKCNSWDANHRVWTSFARCLWPQATQVVDLAGFRWQPELRVATWERETTVLVTKNDSLGHRCDWQVVPGQGRLRRVRVYLASGVTLDPFGLCALAQKYPYTAVAPLLAHLAVSHAADIHRPEDAAWFREALGQMRGQPR